MACDLHICREDAIDETPLHGSLTYSAGSLHCEDCQMVGGDLFQRKKASAASSLLKGDDCVCKDWRAGSEKGKVSFCLKAVVNKTKQRSQLAQDFSKAVLCCTR